MTSSVLEQDAGVVKRGDLDQLRDSLITDLQTGKILVPQVQTDRAVLAGGVNHAPNSDLSYSTLAMTVPGTLPGDMGDDLNFEAFRFYWAERGADVVLDDAHALKSVDHSLYAGNEGINPGIPTWDRENGWIIYGSTATQYDIIVQLLGNIVSPDETWFVRARCAALTADILPDPMELACGFWRKAGADEGYITGDSFTISHVIKGTPGATNVDYRVLAKTDSGVSILSAVLNVPDCPDDLSEEDYVQLYFNAGPGFIEYAIYKKVGSDYFHIYTVRNSTDLQYNDVGIIAFADEVIAGWPVITDDAPTAYAVTGRARHLLVAAYGSQWKDNDLRIKVPSAYNFSLTDADGLYFRFYLTEPTAVDRQVGIDKIWLSTTLNEWSPDKLPPFADGTYPVPSISPTSGNQGGGGGVFEPPPPGGGGYCVVVKTPILTVSKGRKVFKQYQSIRYGDEVGGEGRLPYLVIDKPQGVRAEYREIKTKNGITLRCSVDHPLALSTKPRKRIKAHSVKVGMKLACWVKGRKTTSEVVSNELIPRPAEMGTFTLRDPSTLHRDGDGMYIAGESAKKDRGLFSFNLKPLENQF